MALLLAIDDFGWQICQKRQLYEQANVEVIPSISGNLGPSIVAAEPFRGEL